MRRALPALASEYVPVRVAAAMLGIKTAWVYRRVASCKLPALRVGQMLMIPRPAVLKLKGAA